MGEMDGDEERGEGDRALDSALKLIRGEDVDRSDESVFAGLLLVGKHVPGEVFRRRRGQVLDALPGKTLFFRRLLKSNEAFQRTAVDLIAAFVSSDTRKDQASNSLAKEFFDCLSALEDLCVKNSAASSATSEQESQQGYETVNQALSCILSIVISSSCTFSSGHDGGWFYKPGQVFRTFLLKESSHGCKVSSRRHQLCTELLSATDPATLELHEIEELTESLKEIQSDAFTPLVNLVCQHFDSQKSPFKDMSRSTIENLSAAAFQVLQSSSSAPKEHRLAALHLCQMLGTRCGPSWPLRTDQIPFLLKMVSVEVTLAFTEIRYSKVEVQNKKDEDDINHQLRVLICCFEILETCVTRFTELSQDEEDSDFNSDKGGGVECSVWARIPSAALLVSRDAMVESFSSIVQFVSLIRQGPHDLYERDVFIKQVLQACTKCLGTWLDNGPDDVLGALESAELGRKDDDGVTGGLDTLAFLAGVPGCLASAAHTLALLLDAGLPDDAVAVVFGQRRRILPVLFSGTVDLLCSVFCSQSSDAVARLGGCIDNTELLFKLGVDESVSILAHNTSFAPKLLLDKLEPVLHYEQDELVPSLEALALQDESRRRDLTFFQTQGRACACLLALQLAQVARTKHSDVDIKSVRTAVQRVLARLQHLMLQDEGLSCSLLGPLAQSMISTSDNES